MPFLVEVVEKTMSIYSVKEIILLISALTKRTTIDKGEIMRIG
jgi:hypothetical protein